MYINQYKSNKFEGLRTRKVKKHKHVRTRMVKKHTLVETWFSSPNDSLVSPQQCGQTRSSKNIGRLHHERSKTCYFKAKRQQNCQTLYPPVRDTPVTVTVFLHIAFRKLESFDRSHAYLTGTPLLVTLLFISSEFGQQNSRNVSP